MVCLTPLYGLYFKMLNLIQKTLRIILMTTRTWFMIADMETKENTQKNNRKLSEVMTLLILNRACLCNGKDGTKKISISISL
jgi:hypothetical protein